MCYVIYVHQKLRCWKQLWLEFEIFCVGNWIFPSKNAKKSYCIKLATTVYQCTLHHKISRLEVHLWIMWQATEEALGLHNSAFYALLFLIDTSSNIHFNAGSEKDFSALNWKSGVCLAWWSIWCLCIGLNYFLTLLLFYCFTVLLYYCITLVLQ